MSQEAAPVPRPRRTVPLWIALLAMVLALALAALILSRVAGPLYGLLFPFDAPVPDGAQQVEHVRPDKGAEYWVYRTQMSGDEVARFYEQSGALCVYSAAQPPEESSGGASYSVAKCTGRHASASLVTSWEVYIAAGYSAEEGPTVFRLYQYGEVH